MSTDNTLDVEIPQEGQNPSPSRVLRSTKKWYDKRPDLFTPDEWKTCVDAYVTYSSQERRLEFDAQIASFQAIFSEEAEKGLQEGADIWDAARTLERRAYRVQLLFDLLTPTNTDIERNKWVQEKTSAVREHQAQFQKQREEPEEDEEEEELPEEELDPANLQMAKVLTNDLLQYRNSPDDPTWAQEAEQLDDGENADPVTHIRRYITEIASDSMARENIKHWKSLLQGARSIPVLTQVLSWWTKRFKLSEGQDSLAAAISEAIRTSLAQASKTQQGTRMLPAEVRPVQSQRPLTGRQAKLPQIRPRIPASNPPPASLHQRQPQDSGSSGSFLTDFLRRSPSTSMVNNLGPSRSAFNAQVGQPVNLATNNGTNSSAFNAHATPSGGQPATLEQAVLQNSQILQKMANQSGGNHSMALKLPQVECHKFDGDKLGFLRWWDRFEAVVHTNRQLTDQHKMIFLQQHLTEKSAKFCWGASTDTLTYNDALEKLMQKFCNRSLLVDAYQQRIEDCKMPTSPHDTFGIRHVIDTTQQALSCLARFDVFADQISMPTMRNFRMKMPPELIDALAYTGGRRVGELSLTEFLQVLDEYAKTQEETRDFKELVSGSNSGSNSNQMPRTTMSMTAHPKPAPRNSFPCIFCDAPAGSHSWRYCKFVTDPAERYRRFTGQNRCTCCGSNRHNWTDCPSQKSCQVKDLKEVVCGKKHHNSLHEYFQNKKAGQYNNSGPSQKHRGGSQSAPTNGGNTGCGSAISKTPAIIGIVQGQISPPLKPKRAVKGNIYIDDGSNISYITRKMANALGLLIEGQHEIGINILDGQTITKTLPVTQVRLSSQKGGQAIITCLVTEEIMKPVNTTNWKEATKAFPAYKFPQLQESENPFHIDVLIGTDNLLAIRTEKVKHSKGLECRHTIMGPYIIGTPNWGPTKTHNEGKTHNKVRSTMAMIHSAEDSALQDEAKVIQDPAEAALDQLVFAEDDFNENEDKDPTKHELLKKLNEQTKRVETPEGRLYQVPMLWRDENAKEHLKPNFNLALAFLNKQLEKMEAAGTVLACDKLIKTAIENGFYEVTETNANEGHHIPHFFVQNPHSTSTPVRHVIAGNLGKPAINDVLETGPSLIADLPTLTRQFRVNQIGIVGDISKAFNRLVVHPDDRKFLKILWYLDGDRNKLITLRMARVPFGTCLAPFQLFGTLMFHLNEHENPEAKGLIDALYSDNLVTSVQATHELQYTMDAVDIFGDGGFKLCKFSTNSPELANELKKRDLLNTAEIDTTRVLGMCWQMSTDTLGWYKPEKAVHNNGVVTRRSMLQWLPRHFDPLGLLEGVVMPGRAFQFQNEIYEKYKWDDPLSEDDKDKFLAIAKEITKCMSAVIPRHHDFDPMRKVRLHVFSDASISWGGCCAYLTQDGKSTLVAGKAKKPAKRLEANLTIPKRELEALVLGAKMTHKLMNTYKEIYPHLESHMYSDSQICLSWLTGGKVNAFVNNRVRLIHELCGDSVGTHYIATDVNPSDCVSRGMVANEFLDKKSLFWTGPTIMHDPEIPPFKPEKENENVVGITLATVAARETPSVFNLVDTKSSTMSDIKRKLANLMTCARKWQKKPPLDGSSLSKKVATAIIKAEQEATIPEVIEYLTTKQGPRPKEVHPNQLFLAAGIVRCGGRLGNSSMSYSSRFPIWYPNNSPLIKQRVLEMHETAKHAGPGVTRAKMLRILWIPRSSNVIRKILKNCYTCKKQSGPAFRWPKSPDLPAERIDPQPYNVIGADLTGAFHVRNGNDMEKVYVAIFSDCGTRHISIEILDNMETGTFLQAFRRHCSTYGTPTKVISDQGTYFIKGAAILEENLGEEWCNEIGEAMNRKGIHWQFNPAGAPHFGGHYERLIGTLKGPLKRCIGRAILEKQEFITLCKEAACVMNDRPLTTTNPNDLRDRLPITPNLLVFGRHLSPMPYGDGPEEDPNDPNFEPNEEDVRRQWRRLATRLNLFKKQFAEEYMAYLRTRHQIQHHEDPLEEVQIHVGDLVVMKNENEKRCLWEIAEVQEILPSADARVRAVRLRTKNGECTRPIVKLCPLLTAKELRPEQDNLSERGEAETEQAEANEPNVPLVDSTRAPEPTPRSRPQRAAKAAGRDKVQKWTKNLLDN